MSVQILAALPQGVQAQSTKGSPQQAAQPTGNQRRAPQVSAKPGARPPQERAREWPQS
jgi:hypothetical protein